MSQKHKKPTSKLHRPKIYWVAPVTKQGEENQSYTPFMTKMIRGQYDGWGIHDGDQLLAQKSTKEAIMKAWRKLFPGCELTEISGGRFYCKIKLVED